MRTKCHITQDEQVRPYWNALCLSDYDMLLHAPQPHEGLGHIMGDASNTCFNGATTVQKGVERVAMRPICRYFSRLSL